MPLSTNRTAFTFNHTGQVDEYGASVGDITVVQGNFDSRAEQNLTDINNIKTILKSIIAGDSGAENIGSPTITGVTGNTVHAQIVSLLAIAQEAQAGEILPGTITEVMLAFNVATQAEMDNLAGTGRTTETVKANTDALIAHTDYKPNHVGSVMYAYNNLGGF